MIIVRISGGLGNQMFQYAAGKRLAIARGVELKLDIISYARCDSRSYLLDAFNVPDKLATKAEIRRLKYDCRLWWKIQTSKARNKAKDSSFTYIKEKWYHFSENVMDLGPCAYLHGYWQSEKYFKDKESQIGEMFTFKDFGQNATDIADQIRSCTSVGIHFRRGDYLTGSSPAIFENLTMEYYSKALDCLKRSLGPMHLFVFSDDIPWVRKNAFFEHETTFVKLIGGSSPVEEMWLMSLCCHNVIANSSFSWWGAWLNSNEDKMVIAPSLWFKSEDKDTRDLIPECWTRL